ncbi:MAG: DsbA family oxidoreductase [Bauldia sp.]|nr:MAG: DsbA family oxidoreductase [Bauldia sp.]MBZ0230057.1 DsbA family oxidoreductase [Bauldia sp.]
MTSIDTPLPIDVVSDVVCPWCYLGKRRLAAGLDLAPEIAATVRWLPFRLDPTIPPEGIDRRTYLERKFGSLEAVAASHAALTESGAAVGINFRFDRITRSPNTIDAHRLVRWAEPAGRQDAVVERLFRAYFTEGADIGDRAVLAMLAGEAGLDATEAAVRLDTADDRTEVEAEIEHAYRIGVTGVPCFILGGRAAVMGAQPAATLAAAIRDVAAEIGRSGS